MPTIPDPPVSDERSTYRCPVAGERVGRLQLDRQETDVEIIDESVSGFGIVVSADVECEVGQTALLQTEAGWSEVRIVNVRPLESLVPSDTEQTASSSGKRLGLLRLKDLPSEEPPATSWLRSLFTRLPRVPMSYSMGGTVGAVAGTIVVGLLLAMALEHLPLLVGPDGTPDPSPPRKTEPAGLRRARRAVVELPAISGGPTKPTARTQATTRTASSAPLELIRAIRPEHLLHPDVAPKLGLDHGQLATLRRLARQWETLLQLKMQEAGDAVSIDPEQAKAYEQEAVDYGKRVWDVLSDEQREQWTAHVKASAAGQSEANSDESRTGAVESN